LQNAFPIRKTVYENYSMTEPLFILAPPRSFTSVACGMIGQHPQLFGLPEVNLFAGDDLSHLSRWYRLRPRFQHGLLRAVAELGMGGQSTTDIRAAHAWLQEMADTETGEIYKDLVEWAAPRILVDKSPMYSYDADAYDRIIESFPNARFLHLVRHPRGTCESLFKMRQDIEQGGGRSTEFSLDPDKVWCSPHQKIVEFLETLPNEQWLRIRGEDFLSDPNNGLRQICAWLGIRSDEGDIEAMMHPENSPFACMGPMNARFGNDPGFLKNPELQESHAKDLSLDGPLSYGDGIEFSPETRRYATIFGYS
jgi:hypothetical protein